MAATPHPDPHAEKDEEISPLEPERGLVASIGAGAIELGRTAKELNSVFARTLYYCFYGKSEKGAFFHTDCAQAFAIT